MITIIIKLTENVFEIHEDASPVYGTLDTDIHLHDTIVDVDDAFPSWEAVHAHRMGKPTYCHASTIDGLP